MQDPKAVTPEVEVGKQSFITFPCFVPLTSRGFPYTRSVDQRLCLIIASDLNILRLNGLPISPVATCNDADALARGLRGCAGAAVEGGHRLTHAIIDPVASRPPSLVPIETVLQELRRQE
jgi:hypothetical protein